MSMGKRARNSLSGLAILVGWVVFNFLIALPGKETKIGFFSLLLVLSISMIIAAGVGFGMLVMRLFKVSRAQMGISYIAIGLINIVSGLIGLVSLSVSESGQAAMLSASNLVIGIIIFADACFKRTADLKQ